MSKRRIIVILVILALVGSIGGGVWVYIWRNTGAQLLGRAHFALSKDNWDKAQALEWAGRRLKQLGG